jgi:hypothetical protein
VPDLIGRSVREEQPERAEWLPPQVLHNLGSLHGRCMIAFGVAGVGDGHPPRNGWKSGDRTHACPFFRSYQDGANCPRVGGRMPRRHTAAGGPAVRRSRTGWTGLAGRERWCRLPDSRLRVAGRGCVVC